MAEIYQPHKMVKINFLDFVCQCGEKVFKKEVRGVKKKGFLYVCVSCKRKHTRDYMESQIKDDMEKKYMRELSFKFRKGVAPEENTEE